MGINGRKRMKVEKMKLENKRGKFERMKKQSTYEKNNLQIHKTKGKGKKQKNVYAK